MTVFGRIRRAITGPLPPGFRGELAPGERVVAVAALTGGGHLVLTQIGVWISEGAVAHRIGWHLISKAAWDRSSLLLTEAVSTGTAGETVLLSDLPPRCLTLVEPGRVPNEVRERVGRSIRTSEHVELPGGGAWFVQRRIPGRDGFVLQVRADPGTPEDVVHRMATDVTARLPRLAPPG